MDPKLRKTISQASPDQFAIQLARVDTMTAAIGEAVTKLELGLSNFEKRFSNRMIQLDARLTDITKSQEKVSNEVVKLTVISENNANHIMEIKRDLTNYADKLGQLERRVDDIAAVQRLCPARAMWRDWEEDSKVVRVMRERFEDHISRRTTPGEGLSIRLKTKNLSPQAIAKAIIGAIVAAALAVAGYTTAELARKPDKAKKIEHVEVTNE